MEERHEPSADAASSSAYAPTPSADAASSSAYAPTPENGELEADLQLKLKKWQDKLSLLEQQLSAELQGWARSREQSLEAKRQQWRNTMPASQAQQMYRKQWEIDCEALQQAFIDQQKKLVAAQGQVEQALTNLGIHPLQQQRSSCKSLMRSIKFGETESGIDLCCWHGDIVVTPIPCISPDHGKLASFRTKDGDFEFLKRIANPIYGTVSLYSFSAQGQRKQRVAIKHILKRRIASRGLLFQESDEKKAYLEQKPCLEDPLTEMAVYLLLSGRSSCERCPSILYNLLLYETPYEYLLISEFCGGGEGSLQGGELFTLVADGSEFSEPWMKSAIRQLLKAVQHLHSLNIAHRDISLENLLVNQGRTCVKLFDFGGAARIRSASGDTLRYWMPRGKAYYRSPEQTVPRTVIPNVSCPPGYQDAAEPAMLQAGDFVCEFWFPSGAVAGESYTVTPAGYRLVPADIFACGVVLFVLHGRQPPWGHCSTVDNAGPPPVSGQNFRVYVRSGGNIGDLMDKLGIPLLSENGMELLKQLLSIEPNRRPTAEAALACSWLRPSAEEESAGSSQLPVHISAPPS